MTAADDFLSALAEGLPEDERMLLCGFGGDPLVAGPRAWRPRPWRPGRAIDLPATWNVYVTVGAFGRAGDGSFRRRTETFAAGRALMVDDVGTKVARSTVAGVPPTARIETSPGNEQWWYLLAPPERDAATFDGVIRAFIAGRLLGADPGMSGVTRVGRVPGFHNGKALYGGWQCVMHELNDRRYATEELLARFGLQIRGRRVERAHLPTEEALQRNQMFAAAFRWLDLHNMLKRHEPDPSGWIEAVCPWIDEHTGRANSGFAIREPAPENGYFGAARCHHGHCADKGWAELTEWIAERAAEELESANAQGDRRA